MDCKRRRAPFSGRWTEANPLCTGFWKVKQPRAILARSRGGLNGPPLSYGKAVSYTHLRAIMARGLERRDTSSERNRTNRIFKGRGRRRIPGAVSYTHLFNQAIDILKILVMALGAGLAVWGVINLLEGYGSDNPAAVSYTHLDVYKRQRLSLVDLPSANSMKCCSPPASLEK